MSVVEVSAIIAGAGLLLSLMGALVIVSVSYGRLQSRVEAIERGREDLATKEDVKQLRDSLSEIRGMFRLVLKDGSDAV